MSKEGILLRAEGNNLAKVPFCFDRTKGSHSYVAVFRALSRSNNSHPSPVVGLLSILVNRDGLYLVSQEMFSILSTPSAG
jgi:hypothetical protein